MTAEHATNPDADIRVVVRGQRRASLNEVDAALARRGRPSLNPGATQARCLSTVVQQVHAHTINVEPSLAAAMGEGLAALVAAQLKNFPGNLFWDYDYIAIASVQDAQRRTDPVAHLKASYAKMVELQQLFGQGTTIRFRYIHDFNYGYDWAKWVRRNPDSRAHVGPFDWEFLTYMYRRGHELLALIEADDQKYPRLRTPAPRNPFGFSREPEAERAIHRELANRGLIPVPTWDPQAVPQWQDDYAQIRCEHARALGYARPSG